MHVTAQGYHLQYRPEEDRVLLSVDLSPQQALSMPITRRLIRGLLDALVKVAAQQSRTPAEASPLLRDSILDFEHSQSVANAVAQGNMRNVPEAKRPAEISSLVHEIKLVNQPGGGLSLIFNNSEHLITVEVASDRIHMVIATFVQIAERAGWEFPPVAGWLDPSAGVESAAHKSVN